MPQVSVILPTHNRAHVLGRAVRSVLAQTFVDLELIVVDDGSTDETETVLAGFSDPRLIVLRHSECRGAAVARNTGVGVSSAPWLAFQDSDDVWRIDKLARQYAAIDNDQAAGLICCGYLVMTRAGKISFVSADSRMQSGEWGPDNIYDFGFITPTWLLRRDVFELAGGFDETMPNLEDWELAFRLYQITSIRAVNEPLVIKYGSADSINPDRESRIRSIETIIQRHSAIWIDEPQVLARLYAELGHLQCLMTNTRAGRGNLLKALKLHSASVRYWAKWGISLFGATVYLQVLKLAS